MQRMGEMDVPETLQKYMQVELEDNAKIQHCCNRRHDQVGTEQKPTGVATHALQWLTAAKLALTTDAVWSTCAGRALRLGLGLLAAALGVLRKPLSNMALRSGLRDLSVGVLASVAWAG